jgi:hypothetical protein
LPRKNSEIAAGPYRKPRPNVYTVLLVIALLALLLAIYALYMEMDDFHFEIKGGPPVTWIAPPVRSAWHGQTCLASAPFSEDCGHVRASVGMAPGSA